MNYIVRETWKGGTDVAICRTEVPNEQGELARDLISRFAIIAATPDGEDSSGRQKLRLMTEEECVDRAVHIAALAWEEFRERGWIVDIPLPKPEEEKAEKP